MHNNLFEHHGEYVFYHTTQSSSIFWHSALWQRVRVRESERENEWMNEWIGVNIVNNYTI